MRHAKSLRVKTPPHPDPLPPGGEGRARGENGSGRRDIVAVGLLSLLVLAFFHQAVFTGRVYYQEDIAIQMLPLRVFASDCLKRGELPLWCPNVYAGYPVAAEGQLGLFYPLNLLFLLPIPAWNTFTSLVVLHYWLAALFTYACARRFKLSPHAAVLSAITFTFCAHTVRHLFHMAYLNGLVWLPLALMCCELTRQRTRAREALLTAAVLTVQCYAGHIQVVFLSAVMLLVYVAGALWATPRVGRGRLAALFALSAVLTVGLTAIYWMPLLHLVGGSIRSAADIALSTSLSMPPSHWIGLLIQQMADHRTGIAEPETLWESACYLGLVPLALVCIALVREKSQTARVFAVTLLLSAVFAMGKYTPIYDHLAALPPFSFFRSPSKFLLLFSLSAAMLAGFGLDTLSQYTSRWGWLRHALLFITVLDLFHANMSFNKLTAPSFYTTRPEFLNVVADDEQPQRVFPWVNYGSLPEGANALSREAALLDRETLWGNLGMLYGFESLTGYTPLAPQSYREFAAALLTPVVNEQGEVVGMRSPARLLGLANCKYILTTNPLPPWDFEQIAGYGAVGGYRNLRAMPRAYLVHRSATVASDEDALRYMTSDRFDPRLEAVLFGNPRAKLSPQRSDESVEIRQRRANSVALEVTASSPALLVLADRYDPDWIVEVDGNRATLYRTNYLFRAVAVPPGRHLVEFSYRPWRFYTGALVSLATVLLVAIAGLTRRRLSGRESG